MNRERVVVYGVVGIILVTTLVSGPLVGAVDFTTAAGQPSFGEGNATIGEVTLPERAEITEGRYGSGEYYLRVPDATVDLAKVSGNPLLAYEISIRGMSYSRTTTHFLSSSNMGSYTLSMEKDSLAPKKIEDESYDGRLQVFLRSNGTEQQLAACNITIEVTE